MSAKEKEKATILASASHTVAERLGINGYAWASNKTSPRSFIWAACVAESAQHTAEQKDFRDDPSPG